jgi:dipeptidase
LQTRPNAPELTKGVCWFGPDISYTTCFVPFLSKVEQLPTSYQIGDPQKFSREAAWWAFDFVANWTRLNFQRMCQVDILPLQRSLEVAQVKLLEEWDRKAQDGCSKQELTELCKANANTLVNTWWQLADNLIAKYSDGYINPKPSQPQNEGAIGIGYPSDWLGETNYQNGPITYDMDM